MEITRLEHREPFITADGSSIRELAGIPSGNARQQSLAEATVPLVLLCCCAPAYSHEDTVLTEGD